MKMNKPYIEIVRFDAEDVIATSGVVYCAVSPLSTTEDKVLHYNHNDQNYFVYDYYSNTKIPGDKLDNGTKLHHNGMDTYYSSNIGHPESSTNGYSAYLYDAKDKKWYWWNEDSGSHGDY